MKPFKKLLVPTDFSKNAQLAVERALEICAQNNGHVTLLHVYELPMVYAETSVFTAEIMRDIEKAARAQMKELRAFVETRQRERSPNQPPAVDGKVIAGAPSFAITDEAKEGGYDLIVMGTHGRTGLKRLLIGSVAERVVRTAPCAVLTIRGEL